MIMHADIHLQSDTPIAASLRRLESGELYARVVIGERFVLYPGSAARLREIARLCADLADELQVAQREVQP